MAYYIIFENEDRQIKVLRDLLDPRNLDLQNLVTDIPFGIKSFREARNTIVTKRYAAIDFFFIDIQLDDASINSNGLDLIPLINSHYPNAKCVVISDYKDSNKDRYRNTVGGHPYDYVLLDKSSIDYRDKILETVTVHLQKIKKGIKIKLKFSIKDGQYREEEVSLNEVLGVFTKADLINNKVEENFFFKESFPFDRSLEIKKRNEKIQSNNVDSYFVLVNNKAYFVSKAKIKSVVKILKCDSDFCGSGNKLKRRGFSFPTNLELVRE